MHTAPPAADSLLVNDLAFDCLADAALMVGHPLRAALLGVFVTGPARSLAEVRACCAGAAAATSPGELATHLRILLRLGVLVREEGTSATRFALAPGRYGALRATLDAFVRGAAPAGRRAAA